MHRDLKPENLMVTSDGMAEELINALTQIPALRVVSRTSSFQFKGKADDVRTIGHRLGVRTLLEGSVRTAGERMRIGARLTNAADGYQLWSSQYDREMKDIFAVQDEITGSILAALRVNLITSGDTPLVQPHAGAPEVYKLYLTGRHEWNKRTEEGLAYSYVLLGVYGIRPPSEVMPRTRATAARALEEAADAPAGETEEALSWLAEAQRERSPEMSWIGVRLAFGPLRAQPRFVELVRAIGLPA